LVGLGNYTHPQTRHSIGMLVLDYIASQLNLTWKKNKNWHATVTNTTTIYVDPPKRPKIKQKKEVETNVKKQAKKDTNSIEEKNDGIDDKNIVENENQKKFDDNFRSEDNVSVGLKTVSPKPSRMSESFRPRPRPDPVPLEITLMKPLLLMNVSGKSVSKA
ncbi:16187_t:CDS:2, partial [Racocetra persica]